jgi:hypothetical protein
VNGGQSGGPGYPPPDGGRSPFGTPQSPYGPYGGTQPQSPYGGGTAPVPPYGQDPYASPYGSQEWSSYGMGSEPPKKSRTGLIVALSIAGAVVVLGGTAAAIGVASSGGDKPTAASTTSPPASPSASATSSAPAAGGHHSLTIPASVDDYRQLTGSVADRLAETMRKSVGNQQGAYGEALAKSKIAIYAKNGDSTRPLIFVGLSADDSPAIANELQSRSPSEEVDSTFIGMGIGDTKDYPAGPLGGVLRCGTGTTGTGSAAACAWADSSTVGALITPANSSVPVLAQTTLDLRNAAEH